MQKFVTYLVRLIHKLLSKLGIAEPTRNVFVKYFFNTGWLFAENVLLLGAAFFVGIYVARYLGPEQYGVLNYAFSFVFIFQAFAKLGLDGIVVRELVKNPDNKAKILGTTITLKAIGSIISLLLVFISLQLTASDYETKIIIIIIALGMLFNTFEVGKFFFESQVKAKFSTIASSVSVIISSGLKFLFIVAQVDLVWFAVAYTFEFIIKGISFITIYQVKNKDVFRWIFDKNISKSLLRDSWALIFSAFAASLFLNIDQIMVKEIIGTMQVGYYAAAVKLCTILYFIPVTINTSLFPAIIEAKKTDELLYRKRLRQLFQFQIFLAIITTLPILLLSPFIINILYGNDYINAIPVLEIYILSNIFIFFTNSIARWHLAENNQIISLYRYVSGALLNIILNLIFIPIWGITGAAYATLISYSFIGYFSLFLFKDTRKLLSIINSVFTKLKLNFQK